MSLDFCVAANNSPAPPAQTLTVTANGSTPVGYNANAFPSWVRLNGLSQVVGSTSTLPTISVTIDPSAYSGGGTKQSGTIQINGANLTPITVQVTIEVTSSCITGTTLTATPSSVTLSNSVQSQGVTIAGPNGAQITAALNYGSGPNGWFGISANPFTVGQAVTVSLLSTTNLTNGAQGSITFTLNGTSNSVTVLVTFNSTTGTGNGAFTATPGSINVNFTTASDAAKSQSLTITGLSAQISATVQPGNGPSGWLSIPVQPSGPVPTSFTVVITPTGMLPGTNYAGSIVVMQTNTSTNFVSIPVTATVGTGAFSFSPNPLNFTVLGGGTTQQNQTLTITGPNNAQVTATATINSGSLGWLSIGGLQSTSGTLTNSSLPLTITVNPANLAPNQTYSGNIVITQGSSTVLNIPVTVTTTGNPTLTFTPTQLNFAWQIGTQGPQSQTVNVTSPANTQVNFNVVPSTSTCGNNWMVVFPTQAATNGTTPTPITIQINTTSLPSSTTTCSGNLQITASGASNATTNIPVSLLVSTNPLLLVAPSSLTFNSTPGGGTPLSQTVQVTSSSSTTALSFTNSVTPGTSGGPVFVTVGQNATATTATLTIGINTAVLSTLAPGTYVDNVTINSPSAGNPNVTIPVTLIIANTATLSVNPSSLGLNYQIGTGFNQPSQILTVSSTGAPIQFTAAATSNCGNFLNVFPASGNTLSSTGQNGTTVNVSANVSALTTPATCSGTITFMPAGGGTPVTVNVILNVVNSAVINLGASSVIATAASGSTAIVTPPAISLTSTDASTHISFTATASTTPQGQSWLVIFPQTGTTPSNLNVQLNPSNLAAGTYTGTITIIDNTANSPVPTQMIPVTFIVAAQATANPTSLTFTAAVNGASPATQTITLGGIPASATIAATPSPLTCGTGWLTANVSGNTVVVGVTPTSLTTTAPAMCTGNVAIIVPGAANSPINVPVTVNVTSTTLTVSNNTVSFSFVAGSTAPAAQTVQLTATNNATVPFTAAFAPNTASTPAGLVTITPSTGTTTGSTPVSLSIALSPAALSNLGAGTYGGVITISSPNLANATINVTVTVTQPPPPAVISIVNSATLQSGLVAPGEIITIFGTNIGPATPANLTLTSTGKVATTLGNTQVFFDGTAAPLIYVSATQINAIVPYEVNGRSTTNLTISVGGVTSSGIVLRVTDTAPGIFTLTQNGSGQGAILNQNGTVNGASTPAAKGSVISIYATGEGVINPPGVTGGVTTSVPPFPKPVQQNIQLAFLVPGSGGTTTSIPATLTYAGEAPSLVSGVLQVNAIVPASVPSGPNTIVLTIGANSSPSVVTVQVQ